MSSPALARSRDVVASKPGANPAAAMLSSLRSDLKSLNASSAKMFLELGSALQTIAAQARDIVAVSKNVTGLGAAAEADGPISMLQQLLRDAEQMGSLGKDSRAELHEALAQLAACRVPLEQLSKLPSRLNTVGMLSRIEASRLENGTINVSSLTGDMDGMAADIEKHVTAVVAGAGRLTNVLKDGTGKLDDAEERERSQGAHLVRQVHEVLGSFRSRRDASNAVACKIDEAFVGVHQSTDKIVFSLQAEDIARQRIEHIDEALGSLSFSFEEGQKASEQGGMLRLQWSQLRSTRDFLSGSIAAIHDALRSLGPRLDAVTGETQSLASQTNEDGQSFAATVQERLSALATIFGQYLQSTRAVVTTVDSVLPCVAEMTGAVNGVEEIQASIRLMALNAEIKTAHLGEHGAAMGVLASELHKITAQSDGNTQRVLQGLFGMKEVLAQLADQKSSFTSATLSSADAEGVKKEVAHLTEAVIVDSQKLPVMLAALFDKAGKLCTHLDGALTAVDQGNVLIRTFDDVLKTLDDNLVQLGFGQDSPMAEGLAATDLSKRYSMHSERRVHDEVFGTGISSDAVATAATPTSSDNELGDNVELF